MIGKETYEHYRKVVGLSKECGLEGSEEWQAALKYFRKLYERDKLPVKPCRANGFMIPSYSETVKYIQEFNPRKPRRIQSERALREAMEEAGITQEQIEKTIEILKRP